MSLSPQLIRLKVDPRRASAVVDILTGERPAIWRGSDAVIHIGIFEGDAIAVADNLATLTLEIRPVANAWQPVDPGATPIAAVTVASENIASSPSLPDWTAGTAQHATVTLSAGQTAASAGVYHLTVWAVTTDSPARTVTLASGLMDLREDGSPGLAVEPVPVTQTFFDTAQADARFARRSENLGDLADPATARTNLGLGSVATKDSGTSAGNVPELTAGGTLPVATLPPVPIQIAPDPFFANGPIPFPDPTGSTDNALHWPERSAFGILGRNQRWTGATGISYDHADPDNPYGAVTMVCDPSENVQPGRIYYLEEMGLAEGDTVTFAFEHQTDASETLRWNASFRDETDSIVGGTITTSVTADGNRHVSTITRTVPAGALSFAWLMLFTNPSGGFARVYSMAIYRGASAGRPHLPDATPFLARWGIWAQPFEAIKIGDRAIAGGDLSTLQSVVVGSAAATRNRGEVVIGAGAQVEASAGNDSVVIGRDAIAKNTGATNGERTAIGARASAGDWRATALGANSQAHGLSTTALGYATYVDHSHGTVLGRGGNFLTAAVSENLAPDGHPTVISGDYIYLGDFLQRYISPVDDHNSASGYVEKAPDANPVYLLGRMAGDLAYIQDQDNGAALGLTELTNQAGGDLIICGGKGTGTASGGRVRINTAPGGSAGSAQNAWAEAARFDDSAATGATRMLLYDVDSGQLQRVLVGPNDSAGTGYRSLRVANS